jgi:hypothetical protein
MISFPHSDSRLPREDHLLTEAEVQRTFIRLLKGGLTPEVLDKAETLLDELRAESPLRHRLMTELEELRKMQSAKA